MKLYLLSPLFSCFRNWFVSCDVSITSFLGPPHTNYANETYNSTCLPKSIWNCLYWCILGIIRYSLLYLKQKKTVITSKFNICWENLNVNQVNTIFKISEKVQTKRPLPRKYKVFEKNIFLIQKPWKILEFFANFTFWKLWCSQNNQKNLPRVQCAPTMAKSVTFMTKSSM